MKNIWFNFWAELLLIFRNPREVHRVMAVAPLSVAISHAIYLYINVGDYAYTSSDITAIISGVFGCSAWALWCFLSAEMTVHLFNRFAIVAALTVLYHQVTFYSISLGDTYPKVLSTIAYILLMIWAITGKNYRDFIKDHVQPKVNSISKLFIRYEKKNNIHVISNNTDTAINE